MKVQRRGKTDESMWDEGGGTRRLRSRVVGGEEIRNRGKVDIGKKG